MCYRGTSAALCLAYPFTQWAGIEPWECEGWRQSQDQPQDGAWLFVPGVTGTALLGSLPLDFFMQPSAHFTCAFVKPLSAVLWPESFQALLLEG